MKTQLFIIAALNITTSLSVAAIQKESVSEKTQTESPRQNISYQRSAKTESDKNFLRDRELVLRKKSEMEGRVTGVLPNETEKRIYEELVQAFERNDELSFQSRYQRMMLDYPRGVYADEVVYLSGMMAFSNKLYGRALKQFETVLKQYPRSNRTRAALYAKAAAYRKMNLNTQAVSVFNQVERRYPGSPEARRAQLDLKLMR